MIEETGDPQGYFLACRDVLTWLGQVRVFEICSHISHI